MTHPWAMDNNGVKYYADQNGRRGVISRTPISGMSCVYSVLALGDMIFGQGHDTFFGHRQQLCEISSRSDKTERRYARTQILGICTLCVSPLRYDLD